MAAIALAAGAATAQELAAGGAAEPGAQAPQLAEGSRALQGAEELRDTLPGGARLGDAPELPHATVDVLPRPTRIRIVVRRQAPPVEE
jgi:hypothetical protein